jgi:fibronectin type 3 domain-containing protein
LQAVFSGEGQKPFIDLLWAPDSEGDLAGYNVYRREDGGAPFKVNSEPVKTSAYRDFAVLPGKKYFYLITAVDLRGNESGRSEEASEQVP